MTEADLNGGKVLGVVGTQSSTLHCLDALRRFGYRIHHLISLPASLSGPVADYCDLTAFAAARAIPLTWVRTYAMTDAETVRACRALAMDVLMVVGWQRLIPPWLLERTPLGVYGMHGSALPLPKGRGRSPLNWSLLQQKDRFYTHLFQYDAGIDSGAVIGSQRFDICPWDTIQSLQHKNTVSQYLLLRQYLPAILSGTVVRQPQPTDLKPSYYPKRDKEDGAIPWAEWSARDIDALIRAVTRPYPGAYTLSGTVQVMIWRAAPFDSCLRFPGAEPGQIVDVFPDGTFVVQCLVDTLWVTDYAAAGAWQPRMGERLTSLANASWLKLARMTMEEASGGHDAA